MLFTMPLESFTPAKKRRDGVIHEAKLFIAERTRGIMCGSLINTGRIASSKTYPIETSQTSSLYIEAYVEPNNNSIVKDATDVWLVHSSSCLFIYILLHI